MVRLFMKLLSGDSGGPPDPGNTYLLEVGPGSILMEDGSFLLQE